MPRLLLLASLRTIALALQSAPQPVKTTLPSGIDRLAGTDTPSRLPYVRLFLPGTLLPAPVATPNPAPMLIAQCVLRPDGKHLFDLFANFGGIADIAFHPPWTPAMLATSNRVPPAPQKVVLTMQYLGYIHIKPHRRQWIIPDATPGQYQYNQPSFSSANLEDASAQLRYMLSLPTLRLTLGTNGAEFVTTPLLDAIRKEPLCSAAGI